MRTAAAHSRLSIGCATIALTLSLVSVAASGSPLDRAGTPKAAAPLTYKTVTNRGWKADLPTTWKREERRESGRDSSRGLWTYVSPNRNLKFRVRIRKERGENFRTAALANLARMKERLVDPQVLTNEIDDKGSGQVALFLIRGGMRRNTTTRPYFVFRMVTQGVGDPPVRITLTLAGSSERFDKFMSIYQRVFQTFAMGTTPGQKK